ncbi:protein NUCLEOLAR COMPLEX ASSOCIATED 4 [Typha latifolia]|uniref:protein NUCLEOLAR COMPLEX ASSOCIATED 4 n=1 Tax=Typha latifolia TaxID=4733 RepID=UPI003C2FFBDA
MASVTVKKPKEKKTKKRPRKEEKGDGTLTLDDLKTLGAELLSSRAHINNLPILLSFLYPSSPLDLALESLISIQSFFVPLLPEMPPSSSSSSAASGDADEDKNPESVFRLWLRARFDEFINSLIQIAVSSEVADAFRDVALDAIMDFVKLGKKGRFQSAIYHRFLHSIVHATSSVYSLLDLLAAKYFKYADVRYFTYTSMNKIAISEHGKSSLDNDEDASKPGKEVAIRNMHNILSCFPSLDLDKEQNYEMWSEFGLPSKGEKRSSKVSSNDANFENMNNVVIPTNNITKKLKMKFTKAWLSFLKLPLPLDVYKEVLAKLHQNIIPCMANPAILCDFLTRSYDIGGVISVMALSGLFILMTQHGLEYPRFYEKLYALLTPAVFMAKHRAVFFQLLDMCLKSSYLPAYLAAAFAKKLSRLALLVPPSGALIIIAVIHNLLRRHPSINFLVHWMVDEEDNVDTPAECNQSNQTAGDSGAGPLTDKKKQGIDPFNSGEKDPVKSNAMRSSLWEIDTLRHHYSPAVSRFVASLENDLTIRAKTSEVTVGDFSSGSYATVFRDEIRRRIKQVPLAFYRTTPTSLFLESDFPGWNFGDHHNETCENRIGENGVVTGIQDDDCELVKRQRTSMVA